MTSPENDSPPPNRSAYTLDDGTTMKKEIWRFLRISTGIGRKRGITCMSRFVMSTRTRELILGSLNSGFSSLMVITSSISVACGRFPEPEFGREVKWAGSSRTATLALDILDSSVLT